MRFLRFPVSPTLAAGCLAVLFGTSFATAAVDFEKTIRPILTERCIECHGPDKQKASFRVDRRALLLRGGDSDTPAVVPGNPTKSHLLERVKSTDDDEVMPSKGERLTPDQIAALEQWIAEGAVWPGQPDEAAASAPALWSFLPAKRSVVPAGARNPVDAFLQAKLTETGIVPNGPADARSLIRRATIVLTGLPPPAERVGRFEQAFAQDSAGAYTALVDELLASPHFGERWAQHWLDVIRWAETNGSESNLYRKNAWLYRDYVVRAFNSDLPYDRFLHEQLAGDQLGAGDATGFLVAGPHVPAGTVGQEPSAIRQARSDRMDEILQTIGASLLGVTVGCARCHNHKFDPVSIRDYYALSAIFQGVEFGGRPPEYPDTHPQKQRADDLRAAMERERSVLRRSVGQWVEDWTAFQDLRFPAITTRALRIDFTRDNVGLDELELFGPAAPDRNLALASNGAQLTTDESMIQLRGELSKANDGEYGTQRWISRSPAGSPVKPWVEIRLPAAVEIDRFRLSSNRENHLETDYLADTGPGKLPGFKLSALAADGSWQQLGSTDDAAATLKDRSEARDAARRLHGLIAAWSTEAPPHSFIGRFRPPTATRVLRRGSPETPGEEVAPAGFASLNGDLGLDSAAPDPARRMRFAAWLTRPDHPLTARVMVNRLWQHVFGRGLVATGSDFGRAGAPPTHPELLDWLATEFVQPAGAGEVPWSMKRIIRLLVTSDAFRRSAAPSPAALGKDAGAALLWRFPPRRVEAEVIRDGILLATGKLEPRLGGPSYRIHNVKKTYAQWEVVDNHGPGTWRRMLYQERMRRVDDRIFTAFDFPDCGQVKEKRPVSTTPLQALNLLNSPFVVEQAQFLAERARRDAPGENDAVRRVFALLLNRAPAADELAACSGTDLALVCRGLINSNEFAFLP